MFNISFVIVTCNSAKTIGDCLKSISRFSLREEISFEVIVVDNASGDDTRQIISQFEPEMEIVLISMDKNCGTTFTRNLALRRSKGEYICLLDSDAVLLKGKLGGILQLLKAHQEVGIVAPKLILSTGNISVSVKKFPTIIDEFCKFLLLILFGKDRYQYRGDHYNDFPFLSQREVDTAISACWFFKRELLDKVGYFDEKIFFAPEDVEFCLRVRKSGKKIIYYPDFTVLHHTQSRSRAKPFSLIMLKHIWGLIYMFFKHNYFLKRFRGGGNG